MKAKIERLKRKFNDEDKVKVSCCSICLIEIAIDEEVIALECNEVHIYHDKCLKSWLGFNLTCPLCRKHIVELTG